jgi:hypothetical protein
LWFTIAASVVDLPEPVGPVTSTRPRGWSASSSKIFGALEVFQRQDLGRNGPHHRRRATVLDEGIDAEARQVRHREGKVALQVLFVDACAARRS